MGTMAVGGSGVMHRSCLDLLEVIRMHHRHLLFTHRGRGGLDR